MKTLVLIFSIFLVLSCKNGNNTDIKSIDSPIKTVVKDDILNITLHFKTSEDDAFELFFVDDHPDTSFSESKKLVRNIKGSDTYQVVTFSLPEQVFPYHLRLDIGDNSTQQETPVEIKSIRFQLNANTFEIDGAIMDSFFQPNAFLEPSYNGYLRQIRDGKYDPFLVAKPILIKKMELEL